MRALFFGYWFRDWLDGGSAGLNVRDLKNRQQQLECIMDVSSAITTLGKQDTVQ